MRWIFPTLGKKFKRLETGIVRRVTLPELSISHAMNLGLQEAKGEIVLFLDDDIIPDRNLISAHLKAYEQFSETSVVTGQVLHWKRCLVWSRSSHPSRSHDWGWRGDWRKRRRQQRHSADGGGSWKSRPSDSKKGGCLTNLKF